MLLFGHSNQAAVNFAAIFWDLVGRTTVSNDTVVEDEIDESKFRKRKYNNTQHRTVNHSKHFVNAMADTHINTIEGTWSGMKLKIAPRNWTKYVIKGGLLKFMWCRMYNANLCNGFLYALKQIKLK